ncbi:uncharacterized protein KY384_002682 [Bacidia gigantensis]|uniref:uncharacterized protein n=1 Tax=Bacidia gigantensis TaxID=2732470 RepID=UPI001D036987|nr:uncharacterized protein KY384_002682 [Bacidia gigantensis]KAG8532804.1 hypothetical protein KY384_002682 [Bacidia gigantensis]
MRVDLPQATSYSRISDPNVLTPTVKIIPDRFRNKGKILKDQLPKMASIFTYGTGPAQVASPWAVSSSKNISIPLETTTFKRLAGSDVPQPEALADYGNSKLEAEPQEGPTEYKLHLLLRPRRNFSSTSTVQKVPGSHLSKSRSQTPSNSTRIPSGTSSQALAPSTQSRQNRLQHLTTQLLWRLQQSSPHHTSSKSDLVLPVLPEADIELSALQGPRELLAGLEESVGALYEIGVSDDGTLVGLAIDELEESLLVLRAMAFSLGCNLRLLRMVVVGECQWAEETSELVNGTTKIHQGKLWVAEVLVAPFLRSVESREDPNCTRNSGTTPPTETHRFALTNSSLEPEQLRVSLIGSTTSGKSSLLGTLSTSTFDNGRGKSRLSLLRHRHEIVSGVTSSLAQELIGYQQILQASGTANNVVNYASDNVSSWTDIHHSSNLDRLVFITDSAGHPKFRRTTARGLISWAPHWTLCCVAADDDEDSSGRIGATATSGDVLGPAGQGIDLSKAHLDLCLKLDLPLVVVITKLDLASKIGLRQTVAKVLSTIKASGRKPTVIPVTSSYSGIVESRSILRADHEAVQSVMGSILPDQSSSLVPIVLTSAVTGIGIGQVHSLLRQLPVFNPESPDPLSSASEEQHDGKGSTTVFHVDEIFAVHETFQDYAAISSSSRPCFILSGYLRHGVLQTGDNLLLGPFSSESTLVVSDLPLAYRTKSYPGLSKSLPQNFTAYPSTQSLAVVDVENGGEQQVASRRGTSHLWQTVQVASLRYLRLPARGLKAGQVGTVAISTANPLYLNGEPCIRRGMVLCKPLTLAQTPPAYSCITAVFADPSIYVNPGSTVTLVTASIRTPAKIVEVRIPERASTASANPDIFAFDENYDLKNDFASSGEGNAMPMLEEIEITFRFTNSREWVELGTKVLVTPAGGISMLNAPSRDGSSDVNSGGGGAVAALDGFVGKIVAATE